MIFRLFKRSTQTKTPSAGIDQATKKTKQGFTAWLTQLWQGKTLDADLIKSLKKSLIRADVGPETAQTIIDTLNSQAGHLDTPEAVQQTLKQTLVKLLPPAPDTSTPIPDIILLVGVNGAGKTTCAAKLAKYYKDQGKTPLLAAGDTFRAAAIEQLKNWSKRIDVPVIAQERGSDSASVIFDAMQACQARKHDLLIADTAGRLHNQSNLMQELEKIKRVIDKHPTQNQSKTWLVLDATVGQNGLQQAKLFHQQIALDGVLITKLDGTAKGGIVFAIHQSLNLPIFFIGSGEQPQDLLPFNPEAFVDALLAP